MASDYSAWIPVVCILYELAWQDDINISCTTI